MSESNNSSTSNSSGNKQRSNNKTRRATSLGSARNTRRSASGEAGASGERKERSRNSEGRSSGGERRERSKSYGERSESRGEGRGAKRSEGRRDSRGESRGEGRGQGRREDRYDSRGEGRSEGRREGGYESRGEGRGDAKKSDRRGARGESGFKPRNSGGFKSQRGDARGGSRDTYRDRGRSSSRSRGRSGGGSRFSKTKAIDPSMFMNDVKELTPEQTHEIKHTFDDFTFVNELTNNIKKKGYITPTPIQDQTIHFALEGKDVLGLANTGTGKTAAFCLPMINKIFQNATEGVNALIVAPTRELAQQIEQEFKSFSHSMKLFSTLCVGGLSIHKQKQSLRRNPHVVIGTPGRLKDLIQQNCLDLSDVSTFVLDEVDLMLDMGFIDDIRFIINEIPDEKQTLCFSATMTDSIQRLLQTVMVNPETVSVKTGDTSANVQQDVVKARNTKEKWDTLINILDEDEVDKVLIFCETKSFVQQVSDRLNDAGWPSECIHGDKSQPFRQKALRKFKNDEVQILVATDVAARGIDIPNVSHVINYDTPRVYEDYCHRIGRTGRAGKLGRAITFVKN